MKSRLAVAIALVLVAAAAFYHRRTPRKPPGPRPPGSGRPGSPASARPGLVPAHPPSVLVIAPERWWNGWVDLEELRRLKQAGFEVDFLDNPGELRWERLSTFDAAVVYRIPGDARPLVQLLNRYVDAGGGLLILNGCEAGDDGLAPLLGPWGARIPRQVVRETDEAKLAPFPGTAGRLTLALTRAVAPHPVTAGVRALWLPEGDVKATGASVPLELSADWQPLVRAASTALTEPPGKKPAPRPPGEAPSAPPAPPPETGTGPVVAAARTKGAGRVVLAGVWPEFTLGQGRQWPHAGVVLERGARGVPSDGEVLLRNALHWLTEKARAGGPLGGSRTPPGRLADPNTRPEARQELARAGAPPRAADRTPFRGVIGARTTLSGGSASLPDLAAEATRLKLDYLVILEDFARLTPDGFKGLVAQCQKATTPALALIPGWMMRTNLGGRVAVWGGAPWPPKDALDPADATLLRLRSFENDGRNVAHAPTARWLSSLATRDTGAAYWRDEGSPWHADQLRPIGGMVVRGEDRTPPTTAAAPARPARPPPVLATDCTGDYLDAVAQQLPVLPLGVSTCASVAELAATRLFTVVRARSRDKVVADALHWPQPGEGADVQVTDGPRLPPWGALDEARAFAAEDGGLAQAYRALDRAATADAGLARVVVYDGPRVLQRVDLAAGAAPAPLPLCALEQRALVLEAVDRAGGRAISSVLRCYKVGGMELIPTGDRTSDQRGMQAHPTALGRPAEFALGYSSGAVAHIGPPVVSFPLWFPVAVTTRGATGDHPPLGASWLDAGDEQAAEFHFHADRMIEESSGVNFPLPAPSAVRASRVATMEVSWLELARPATGPAPVGPPGRAVRAGPTAQVLTQRLVSQADQLVHTVRWLIGHTPRESEALTIARRAPGGSWASVDVPSGSPYRIIPVAPGAWLRLASPSQHRQILVRAKGPPLLIQVEPQGVGSELRVVSDLGGRPWPKDTPLELRLLCWTDPTDGTSTPAEAAALADELESPPGLAVEEGRLLDGHAEVQVEAARGRALIRLGPARARDLTLPVTIRGLQRAFSAYSVTQVTTGTPVVSPMAVDSAGCGFVAAHPTAAGLSIRAGQPVLASDPRVLVTVVAEGAGDRTVWHVEADNPTDAPITAELTPGLDLPGLSFAPTPVTLAPGGVWRASPGPR